MKTDVTKKYHLIQLQPGLILPILFLMVNLTGSFTFAQQNRPISFGTLLEAQNVIEGARKLAKSLINPASPQWRANGDQRRTYFFSEANANEPYRVCVPENWDGKSKLPLVMFLHGGGSNESSYLDQNNKQMVKLANEHGFLLVSPMGDKGAYGNFLRLSAPFGNEKGAADLMAQVTPASELTNELSEKDVINVLELILHEYPIDSSAMFLTGHSMGSGGTWYIGGKYRNYWNALAPMSGPFVQEKGYPWDSLHQMSFFVTEGIQTPSLEGSRAIRSWMNSHGFNLKYKEVNADHGGMVPIVLPDVFDFFDSCRTDPVRVVSPRIHVQSPHIMKLSIIYQNPQSIQINLQLRESIQNSTITIYDDLGRECYSGVISIVSSKSYLNKINLSTGTYFAKVRSGQYTGYSSFIVTN